MSAPLAYAASPAGRKSILVLGYGGMGSQSVAELAKKKLYDITVLTPFNYMEVSVNMTKSLAAGEVEHEKCIFPLLQEDGVEYISGVCSSLTGSEARTEKGRVLPFDVCIVAVGQHIPLIFPSLNETTMEQRKSTINSFYSDLLKANHVVIGGGGPIGTELAAEIKLRHKDKRVTIVQSEKEVLHLMKDAFRLKAQAFLTKIGIELILSDRVTRFEQNTVFLGSGRSISADLYVPCFSTGGNAQFLPEKAKTPRNFAKVNEFFQIEGFENVFAAGDCSDYDQVKGLIKVKDQLSTLVTNVENHLSGKPLVKHIKGKSLYGQMQGPPMVAFGHNHPEGYGVGPMMPGCWGPFLWCMCCCSTPAGHYVSTMKGDFNNKIIPRKGKGISAEE